MVVVVEQGEGKPSAPGQLVLALLSELQVAGEGHDNHAPPSPTKGGMRIVRIRKSRRVTSIPI